MSSIWENAVITNKGIALQAKILAGGTITITSVKSGAGAVEVATLMGQTAVSNIKQTLTMQPVRVEGLSTVVPVLLTNTGLSTSYDLRQIGFYANDPDEGEILYAIAQNTEARNIPTEADMPGYSLIWNFYFNTSNDLNMDVTIDPAGLASLEALSQKADKSNPIITGSFSQNRKIGSTVGNMSHAEGSDTEASGVAAHSEGGETKASGNYSHAGGIGTEALLNQYAIGHYNDSALAKDYESGASSGTAFVVGNGTADTASNAFRVEGTGKAIGKTSFASTGADYAEYFEWEDQNPDNEDRVGYFVTFADGRFIKKADQDDYILGIVSGMPCIIGNNDEGWMKQFETDEWGRFVYHESVKVDEETGEKKICKSYKINPDYDKNQEYIHRDERPEWSAVGMMGVLSVRDDGTCLVNGYCKCTNGGIATACERGENTYRVIERVTDYIVKVVFRP